MGTTAELEGQMDDLKAEIGAMTKQLSEEQGSVSIYTDRQTKALALKATTEAELAQQNDVLKNEENSRIELAAEVKAHSGSIGAVEQEKGNRDHTIKVLQDEIAEQDEVINKLNKEK